MSRPSVREIFFVLATVFAFAGPALSAERLSRLEGETLAGAKIVLPDAASSEPTLIIATFDKQASGAARDWLARLQVSSGLAALRIHTVAFLDSMPGFALRMAMSGMRRGVPKALHPTFVVVAEDPAPWKRAFAFARAEDAYLLLVGPDGTVHWQTAGTVSAAAISALQEKLASLAP